MVTTLLLNYVASSIQLWYFTIIEEITGEIFCEDSGIVIKIQILEDRPPADSFLTWTHGTLNQ